MNKTYLTVAFVFGVISGSLMALAAISTLVGSYPAIAIFYIVIAALDFAAAIQIRAYRDGKGSRGAALGWSIFLLFFSLIGGIFGIIGCNSKSPTSDYGQELKN